MNRHSLNIWFLKMSYIYDAKSCSKYQFYLLYRYILKQSRTLSLAFTNGSPCTKENIDIDTSILERL